MIKEHQSKAGHWFTIVAKNNKILATSEMYKTKQAMRKGKLSLVNILQLKIVYV